MSRVRDASDTAQRAANQAGSKIPQGCPRRLQQFDGIMPLGAPEDSFLGR
jgi:hypothetical protein